MAPHQVVVAALTPRPLPSGVGAALAALVTLLMPAVASACPYCAAGSSGGVGLRVALGAFLALPFGVAGVVYSFLRREAE